MINPLRKRHLAVWRILAIGVPILLLISAVNAPKGLFGGGKKPERVEASYSNGMIRINLTRPLKSPFTEIYVRAGAECKDQVFVGRIDAAGDYAFKLETEVKPCEVFFYDYFNQTELLTIDLK